MDWFSINWEHVFYLWAGGFIALFWDALFNRWEKKRNTVACPHCSLKFITDDKEFRERYMADHIAQHEEET